MIDSDIPSHPVARGPAREAGLERGKGIPETVMHTHACTLMRGPAESTESTLAVLKQASLCLSQHGISLIFVQLYTTRSNSY